MLHSYLKHRLLFEGTETSGIIALINEGKGCTVDPTSPVVMAPF